jgi:putative Ca2+/H+ antiporter (TMEM165/GDT1 family)
LGYWLTSFVNPDLLKWILGLSFLGIGLWLLVPDHVNDAVGSKVADRALQVFLLTGGLFFVAEMGDKTQIATIALGAKYSDVLSVTVGTTLGMMLANVPAVWIGQTFTKRIPIKLVHAIAAFTFIAIGIATLVWA